MKLNNKQTVSEDWSPEKRWKCWTVTLP